MIQQMTAEGYPFRLFISWSGERSRLVAEGLRTWIKLLVDRPEVWMSASDIPDGNRWSAELAEILDATDFGVVVLTAENRESPWLLFEAGALSKHLRRARVIPYLVGVDKSTLSGPLGHFQALPADRDGTHRLVTSILDACSARATGEAVSRRFEAFWPELELVLIKARATPAFVDATADRRDTRIVSALQAQVAELTTLVRQLVPAANALQLPVAAQQSSPDLRMLEGSWESERSQIHVRIINGRVYAPYCYEGSDELTAVYYDWQPYMDHFFARFKWFKHPPRGFAFYKPIDRDTLHGMWWLSADVPVESFVAVPSAGGAKATWHRVSGASVPRWAQKYFRQIEQKSSTG